METCCVCDQPFGAGQPRISPESGKGKSVCYACAHLIAAGYEKPQHWPQVEPGPEQGAATNWKEAIELGNKREIADPGPTIHPAGEPPSPLA